jgi:hypothetical protein
MVAASVGNSIRIEDRVSNLLLWDMDGILVTRLIC